MPALPSSSWSETNVKCKALEWRLACRAAFAAAAAAIIANHHPAPGHPSARFFSEEHEVTGLKHNQGWLKVDAFEGAILPRPLVDPTESFACEVGSWMEGKGGV